MFSREPSTVLRSSRGWRASAKRRPMPLQRRGDERREPGRERRQQVGQVGRTSSRPPCTTRRSRSWSCSRAGGRTPRAARSASPGSPGRRDRSAPRLRTRPARAACAPRGGTGPRRCVRERRTAAGWPGRARRPRRAEARSGCSTARRRSGSRGHLDAFLRCVARSGDDGQAAQPQRDAVPADEGRRAERHERRSGPPCATSERGVAGRAHAGDAWRRTPSTRSAAT